MKEFIDDLKDLIEWVIAGCPKPVRVPIKPKDGERNVNGKKKLQR